MTIKDRAYANPAYAQTIADKDIDVLVTLLNAEAVTEVRSRFITARTILAECGAQAADILDALEAGALNVSALKWAVQFLGQDSGIDIGNPATQAMLDQLVLGRILTTAHADALKALAMVPVFVTREQVEEELYNIDGSTK